MVHKRYSLANRTGRSATGNTHVNQLDVCPVESCQAPRGHMCRKWSKDAEYYRPLKTIHRERRGAKNSRSLGQPRD